MAYLAAAIAPGADTTLVLTRALDSRGKAWLAGAGIAAAKVLLLAIAYLGASAFLIQNPELLLAAKFFGAGFLGYRALVLWRRSKLSKPPRESSAWADFGLGFGTAFTNPQPLAFYLAIVPQVAATTNLGVLSLIVILGFALVTLVYSSLARPISSALTKRGPGFVNRVVAVLLLLVAAWILLR
jgi:threonine/homoserine/homoserine lactone efflux protein